jgi:FkbM family methyltransferase
MPIVTIKRAIKNRVLRSIHGASSDADIRRMLPEQTFDVIFDVGAHHGQTCARFRAAHPSARIYAFEPDAENFKILSRAPNQPNIRFFRIALSSAPGTVNMSDCENNTMRRISTDGGNPVECSTVDLFCRSNEVQKIDYLKIDTEGHDLEVLKGAQSMLRQSKINFVEAECSVNPDNTYHVQLCDAMAFLQPFGYRLFGIYEQTHEWITGSPNLRRVNAVFLSIRPFP